MVADGQRDLVPAQQLVDLVAEPARVAELEAVHARRQAVERTGQRVVVALEPLRQLPEHRAELRGADERLDALVEAPDALVDLAQLLHVDQEAARLEGEDEVGRRLLDPPRDRVARGEAVEGRVHLDGVENLRVPRKPPWLAHALRVQDAAPAAVLPAAAADANRPGAHSAARSALASSCSVAQSLGFRSAAAGWNIGNSVRPSRSMTFPCACVIFTSGANRTSAWRPSGTISFGSITPSCAPRHGRWWATSSAFGSRLPGGRALTTFVMNTSARSRPASSSRRSSSLPAPPTNGRPDPSPFPRRRSRRPRPRGAGHRGRGGGRAGAPAPGGSRFPPPPQKSEPRGGGGRGS